MSVFSLNKNDIEKIIDPDEIIEVVERSFADYCSGKAVIPPVTNLDIAEKNGEIHIKSSHISGYDNYCIKIASGFYNNKDIGLPTGYGIMLLFSSETGILSAVILDEGLLTDLRTAAAGAVAAKHLARKKIDSAGVIGTGVQGRLQIQFLENIREFDRLYFWDIDQASAGSYHEDMSGLMPDIELINCYTPEDVAVNSDIIVTCTPSKKPLLKSEWIRKGTHITAMGSDGADKQELDPEILINCDKVITDHFGQCSILGETHHAIKTGLPNEDVHAELGELILGERPGRESDDEITVCDLTGVAVQDLAISNWCLSKAIDAGLGREIKI